MSNFVSIAGGTIVTIGLVTIGALYSPWFRSLFQPAFRYHKENEVTGTDDIILARLERFLSTIAVFPVGCEALRNPTIWRDLQLSARWMWKSAVSADFQRNELKQYKDFELYRHLLSILLPLGLDDELNSEDACGTLIFHAIAHTNSNAVRALLLHDNLRTNIISSRNKSCDQGDTPLALALRHLNDEKVLLSIVERSSSDMFSHIDPTGRKPIHYAIRSTNYAVLFAIASRTSSNCLSNGTRSEDPPLIAMVKKYCDAYATTENMRHCEMVITTLLHPEIARSDGSGLRFQYADWSACKTYLQKSEARQRDYPFQRGFDAASFQRLYVLFDATLNRSCEYRAKFDLSLARALYPHFSVQTKAIQFVVPMVRQYAVNPQIIRTAPYVIDY